MGIEIPLGWDSEHVGFYTGTADIIVVEREKTIELLTALVGYRFPDRENLTFLDLGCGDGTVTRHVRRRYPQSSFSLLDGSAEMLARARQELGSDNMTFVHQTFEAYIDQPANDAIYDGIYSANAIHHLEYMVKAQLYAKLYRELAFGGLVLNIDPVLPASTLSERWQFNMWRDWMNGALIRNGRADEVGTFDDLPARYKRMAENRPSRLVDQLQLLAQVGFRDVDCFYKHGVFALFGGTK